MSAREMPLCLAPAARRVRSGAVQPVRATWPAGARPWSGEFCLQEQPRSPELEPGPPVVAVGSKHEKQIIVRGDGAYHQRQPVRGDREVMHLAGPELAMVLG